VWLVHKGAATPEASDLALRRGLGGLCSIVGPFQAMALGGPRTFQSIAAQLFPEQACDVATGPPFDPIATRETFSRAPARPRRSWQDFWARIGTGKIGGG
jgi:3-hydroxyacyl-CoA dehydrogenase